MFDKTTYERETARLRAEQRLESGLCIMCGREWTGRWKTCEACRAKVSERGKRRWEAIRAKVAATGICYKCGKKPVRMGQLMCPGCAFIEAERSAKYKAARKQMAQEQGLCVECMREKARPGKSSCWMCALKDSERKYKHYHGKKAEGVLTYQ